MLTALGGRSMRSENSRKASEHIRVCAFFKDTSETSYEVLHSKLRYLLD
jgi:hypothetical protein